MRVKGRIILGICLVIVALVAVLAIVAMPREPGVLASVRVSDGRVFQVEAVTYGTNHFCGESSYFFEHFGVWIPSGVRKYFEPKQGRAKIDVTKPSLVVWVNAINPTNGAFVDCQGVRMEFVDQYGDVSAASHPHWFGGSKFWRVGHVFDAYPRDAKELTLQIVPWRAQSSQVKIQNPHVVEPEKWAGKPAPQREKFGSMELELTRLTEQTNGSPKKNWETPTRYWKPDWKLFKNGKNAEGWDKPEWFAEDSLGNRGEALGIHQPALRFTATVYPSATNLDDSVLVTKLPTVSLTNGLTNWWNIKAKTDSTEVVALGVFPPGAYAFLEGNMVTNPAVPMSAVRGGAPSGWTGRNERISPMQVKYWKGHYTDKTVVYISAPSLPEDKRLGIRLRDEQGNYWLAQPEAQGHPQGIYAFMIKLPKTVKTVVPELVSLNSVKASFVVNTPAPATK